jgi:hypothetical protein
MPGSASAFGRSLVRRTQMRTILADEDTMPVAGGR